MESELQEAARMGQSGLLLATVVFPDNVYEVVLGDQCVLQSRFGFLSFSPLLLVQVRRVEKLRGQDGPCGLDPVYHVQEQSFVVVIHKGDGCSPVSQPTRPAHLGRAKTYSYS